MIPSIIISVSYLVSQSLAPYLHFKKHIIANVIKTVNSMTTIQMIFFDNTFSEV